MQLGYQGKLFILAFDHRGSFRKRFGIEGTPSAEDQERLRDAKMLVFEGFLTAAGNGSLPGAGILVDEEMGADVAFRAKELDITLAMPVEKSGQDVFDFEFGEDFAAHIEKYDPSFAKVLVRWNPDDDPADKSAQSERLKRLSDWLHQHDRKFLFELLVPASDRQLELVGGDAAAYDTELRPALTLESISEIQTAGIEPDIWKIEGLDRSRSCELLAGLIRGGGRDDVKAVVLGRGADDGAVEHWLKMGAGVDGYIGFAIGRTIWGPGIDEFVKGDLGREAAAAKIGEAYRRFHAVYEEAAG